MADLLACGGAASRGTAGWTGPAHASLFTGLRPENHGYIRGNREYLSADFTTLAERLRAEGYQTGCLTNNPMRASEFGLLEGFDRVAAHLEPGEASVGAGFQFEHLAATPCGETVVATARVTEVDGRRVTLAIEARYRLGQCQLRLAEAAARGDSAS